MSMPAYHLLKYGTLVGVFFKRKRQGICSSFDTSHLFQIYLLLKGSTMAASHFFDFRMRISLFRQSEQSVSMCKCTKKNLWTLVFYCQKSNKFRIALMKREGAFMPNTICPFLFSKKPTSISSI